MRTNLFLWFGVSDRKENLPDSGSPWRGAFRSMVASWFHLSLVHSQSFSSLAAGRTQSETSAGVKCFSTCGGLFMPICPLMTVIAGDRQKQQLLMLLFLSSIIITPPAAHSTSLNEEPAVTWRMSGHLSLFGYFDFILGSRKPDSLWRGSTYPQRETGQTFGAWNEEEIWRKLWTGAERSENRISAHLLPVTHMSGSMCIPMQLCASLHTCV